MAEPFPADPRSMTMSDPSHERNDGIIEEPSTAEPNVGRLAAEREIETRGRNLREHAARGTIINSGFQVGLAGIGVLRRVLVAAFLTQEEFGLWGILVSTLITLAWLKQVGIADKYIQQTEADQEVAFQKAFTLELTVSVLFFILVIAALPLYAQAYGHPELLLPGIVLALSVPISAFETPTWIAYRRMQFVRQRSLTSVDPLVAFFVTVLLGILGFGYWCLILGAVAGSVAGGVVATMTCPYRLRLRFERSTISEYTRFSWPLVGLGVSNLLTVQGTLLVANHAVGLGGVGAIGLASTIASFADRVDGIVSQTIYPVVCAVSSRLDLLHEAFVKSNRLTLMWAIPFGAGLSLFASDLVHFVLGEDWEPAIPLIATIGLIVGFTQVAFNWSIFMRAINDTKPIFQASLVSLVVFAFVMVPAILMLGLTGYVVGFATSVALQIAARGFFLRRLFPGFNVFRHLLRAIAPSVPAAGIILLIRLMAGGDRTLLRAICELVLYIALSLAFTALFERRLVRELLGYLRGPGNQSFFGVDRAETAGA